MLRLPHHTAVRPADSKANLPLRDQWRHRLERLECCTALQCFHFIPDIVLPANLWHIFRLVAVNVSYREVALSCLQVLSDSGDILSYPYQTQWVWQSLLTYTHIQPHVPTLTLAKKHTHLCKHLHTDSCEAVRLIGTLSLPLQFCVSHFVLFSCTLFSLATFPLSHSPLFTLLFCSHYFSPFPSSSIFSSPSLSSPFSSYPPYISSYSSSTSRLALTQYSAGTVFLWQSEKHSLLAQGEKRWDTL